MSDDWDHWLHAKYFVMLIGEGLTVEQIIEHMDTSSHPLTAAMIAAVIVKYEIRDHTKH